MFSCAAPVIEMVIINFWWREQRETFCQIFFPSSISTTTTTIFSNINKVPKWPFRQFCVQREQQSYSRCPISGREPAESPIELLLQIDWIFFCVYVSLVEWMGNGEAYYPIFGLILGKVSKKGKKETIFWSSFTKSPLWAKDMFLLDDVQYVIGVF